MTPQNVFLLFLLAFISLSSIILLCDYFSSINRFFRMQARRHRDVQAMLDTAEKYGYEISIKRGA